MINFSLDEFNIKRLPWYGRWERDTCLQREDWKKKKNRKNRGRNSWQDHRGGWVTALALKLIVWRRQVSNARNSSNAIKYSIQSRNRPRCFRVSPARPLPPRAWTRNRPARRWEGLVIHASLVLPFSSSKSFVLIDINWYKITRGKEEIRFLKWFFNKYEYKNLKLNTDPEIESFGNILLLYLYDDILY